MLIWRNQILDKPIVQFRNSVIFSSKGCESAGNESGELVHFKQDEGLQ